MKLSFTKMQGAGNDFVVIDNRDPGLDLDAGQIRRLCDRHFGIGADGLILLEKSPEAAFDGRMVYHNSDGSRGEMCGNGARCFTAFALARGLGRDGAVRFVTDAGPMAATLTEGLITIQMTAPAGLRLNEEVSLKSGPAVVHFINTGVPHVVKFVEDISTVDIRAEGAELRHHPHFAPTGANANFAQVGSGDAIRVRTYERGVEDETLACGTGVTATAIVAHLVKGVELPVRVQVAGGDLLQVDFQREGETITNVTLTGPAAVVFEGRVEI